MAANRGLTDDQILAAIEQAGTKAGAAAQLGIGERGLKRRVSRINERRNGGETPEPSPKDADHRVKGRSTLYDAETGEPKLEWVKTTVDEDAKARMQERFAEALCSKVEGMAERVPAPEAPPAQELMSCYVVGDGHLGLRAWYSETQIDNHDTDIATRDMRGAIRYLVDASPASEVGCFVNVGDILHANDTTSETPNSKARLDTDGRFGDVIDHAVDVITFAIREMLRKHQIVRVVNARGNHDPDAAIFINKLLYWYYRDEPRVEVVQNDSKFIFLRWGKTLIGIHHGDRIKRQQIYEAMTRDRRKDWGECHKAYFWTGHIHHKNAEEIGGCLFESFNTLAAPDAWHANSGYGANREMQCLIMSREHGLVGRNNCALEMARGASQEDPG